MQSLCERTPKVVASDIIQEFVVPKRFAHTTFSNYVANPEIESQGFAKSRVSDFAGHIAPKRSLFRRSAGVKAGIYLDGGFGVGKTHLLTALWHQYGTKSTYGSFVEYTNLVGALGFQSAVDTLAKSRD